MYGAFDVVLYFVNPTVLVANKLTSYLISYLILSYLSCGLLALSAGANRRCDHAPSVERFGTSGLVTSQTIQSDELTNR